MYLQTRGKTSTHIESGQAPYSARTQKAKKKIKVPGKTRKAGPEEVVVSLTSAFLEP